MLLFAAMLQSLRFHENVIDRDIALSAGHCASARLQFLAEAVIRYSPRRGGGLAVAAPYNRHLRSYWTEQRFGVRYFFDGADQRRRCLRPLDSYMALARMLNMLCQSIISIVAVMLVISIAPVARAQVPFSVCRWAGIGWSDGYHSHTACPPRSHAVYRAAPPVFSAPVAPIAPVAVAPNGSPTPAALPWWKTPASHNDAGTAEPLLGTP